MKKIFYLLFVLITASLMASSNIDMMKENYKYSFIYYGDQINEFSSIGIGDRFEADVLLELADESYTLYNKSYKQPIKKNLPKSKAIVLIMPKIELVEKHLKSLAKKTGNLYLFIMEDDKLEGEYGDRSYQTFIAKGLDKDLPNNVKVYKLENDSVTSSGTKNNFEVMAPIRESRVFKRQIQPILVKEDVK